MKAIGISVPPFSTYKQSFNFRSFVVPEISLDEKSVTNNNQPATQSASHPITSICRGGSTLGQGDTCPQIHSLTPPDSKASWLFWCDFWGPKMLQNPNFPGLCPDPAGAAYSTLRPHRCPYQEPHPRSRLFGPRFYGSQGPTHYRVGNPTNDRFQM